MDALSLQTSQRMAHQRGHHLLTLMEQLEKLPAFDEHTHSRNAAKHITAAVGCAYNLPVFRAAKKLISYAKHLVPQLAALPLKDARAAAYAIVIFRLAEASQPALVAMVFDVYCRHAERMNLSTCKKLLYQLLDVQAGCIHIVVNEWIVALWEYQAVLVSCACDDAVYDSGEPTVSRNTFLRFFGKLHTRVMWPLMALKQSVQCGILHMSTTLDFSKWSDCGGTALLAKEIKPLVMDLAYALHASIPMSPCSVADCKEAESHFEDEVEALSVAICT